MKVLFCENKFLNNCWNLLLFLFSHTHTMVKPKWEIRQLSLKKNAQTEYSVVIKDTKWKKMSETTNFQLNTLPTAMVKYDAYTLYTRAWFSFKLFLSVSHALLFRPVEYIHVCMCYVYIRMAQEQNPTTLFTRWHVCMHIYMMK